MDRRHFITSAVALASVSAAPTHSQSESQTLVANVRTPRGQATVTISVNSGTYFAAVQRRGETRRYRMNSPRAALDRIAQALRTGPGQIVLPDQTILFALDQDGRRLRAGRGDRRYEATVSGVAIAMGGGFVTALIVAVVVANDALRVPVTVEAGNVVIVIDMDQVTE